MKYKVGDMVKVRNDLKPDKKYGAWCTVPEMMEHLGKVATITEVHEKDYHLSVDDEMWYWTNEMLEPM